MKESEGAGGQPVGLDHLAPAWHFDAMITGHNSLFKSQANVNAETEIIVFCTTYFCWHCERCRHTRAHTRTHLFVSHSLWHLNSPHPTPILASLLTCATTAAPAQQEGGSVDFSISGGSMSLSSIWDILSGCSFPAQPSCGLSDPCSFCLPAPSAKSVNPTAHPHPNPQCTPWPESQHGVPVSWHTMISQFEGK